MSKEPNDQEQEGNDVDDTDLNELFDDEVDGEGDTDTDDPTKQDGEPDKEDAKPDDQGKSEDDDTKDESDDEETGEDGSEPPADGEDDRKMVPVKALHDERRKSRALKEELEQLKNKEGLSEDELGIGPEPDRYENPEEHDAWLEAKYEAKQQRAKQQAYVDLVDRSREKAIDKYDDYEEKEGIFLMLARKDPQLREDMIDSKDPASFVYKAAKKWEADKEAKLLERLKAEGKLKDESEESSDKPADKKSGRKKRPSLATATGAGSASKESMDFDPDDLDDLVGDQGY